MNIIKRNILILVHALSYSFQGLVATYKSEVAFRQETIISLILIPLALFLHVSAIAKILLIGSILLVLITELTNSAIEATIDRISEKKHPLSKKAKDIGSATVLLSLINAAMVWLVILLT